MSESRLTPLLPGISPERLALAHQAWQRRANTFETTAVGRLFDAAAALPLEEDQDMTLSDEESRK